MGKDTDQGNEHSAAFPQGRGSLRVTGAPQVVVLVVRVIVRKGNNQLR